MNIQNDRNNLAFTCNWGPFRPKLTNKQRLLERTTGMGTAMEMLHRYAPPEDFERIVTTERFNGNYDFLQGFLQVAGNMFRKLN